LRLKVKESIDRITKEFKKKNPKAKEVPEEIFNSDESRELEEFLSTEPLVPSFLVDVISYRMRWLDVQQGAIVCLFQFESNYASFENSLKSINLALPAAHNVIMKCLNGNSTYNSFLTKEFDFLKKTIDHYKNEIKLKENILQSVVLEEELEAMEIGSQIKKSKNYEKSPKYEKLNNLSLSDTNHNKPETNLNKIVSDFDTADIKSITFRDDKDNNMNQEIVDTNLTNEETKSLDLGTKFVTSLVGDEPWCDLLTMKTVDLDDREWKLLTKHDRVRYIGNKLFELRSFENYYNSRLMQFSKMVKDQSFVDLITTPTEYQFDLYTQYFSEINTIFSDEILRIEDIGNLAISKTSELNSLNLQVEDKESIYFIEIKEDDYLETLMNRIETSIRNERNLILISSKNQSRGDKVSDFQLLRKPSSLLKRNSFDKFEILPDSSNQLNSLQYRWLIEANSSISINFKYSSDVLGTFKEIFKFEVLGTLEELVLTCLGYCDYPKICCEPRHVFMNRLLKVTPPDNIHPFQKYIIPYNYYSMGCQYIINSLGTSDNDQLLRISNIGKFSCFASFEISCENEVFKVQPNTLSLEEGESKDIRINCWPTIEKEFIGYLLIKVKDNPEICRFELRCWGIAPKLIFDGPWVSAISDLEVALVNTNDKKLIKEIELKMKDLRENYLIDFNRILVNKDETFTFTILSDSMLPVEWTIDTGDFSESTIVSFSPSYGEVQPHGQQVVTVKMKSLEPVIVGGSFTISYTGCSRKRDPKIVKTMKKASFKLKGEVYKVQAVAITNSNNDSVNEINFGSLKVGELAHQSIVIENIGKYDIGYKFKVTKSKISDFLLFEPNEGTISPGKNQFSVCAKFNCPNEEINLRVTIKYYYYFHSQMFLFNTTGQPRCKY
jgi:hypothetical protein